MGIWTRPKITMNKKFLPLIVAASLSAAASLPVYAEIFNDSANDIDPGIANAGGTLDILSMEVTNTATDLIMTLMVNGDISATDWGKFMIGIATGEPGTTTGNGWGRPINMDSPGGGMDYWIGAWVDGGNGSVIWNYDGASWVGPTALAGYSFTPGPNSTLAFTMSLASLGLAVDDTFYFDAYSSGGGGTDSAVDALSNPNISISAWDQPYTSSVNPPGTGISSYQIIPEPVSLALLGLAGAALGIHRLRRRRKP